MVILHKEKSVYDFDVTCNRIHQFLEFKNIPIFTAIDHRENAEKVGLKLRPEIVILFGSPLVGTHIIEENPDIGLELPLRVLVFQEDSSVYVTFVDYDDLMQAYHISKHSELGKKLASLMAELAIYATRK
ncbi:MAG: DUF302 domain-containing protein [Candidatus Thermoplasmatota archaeon]|jgi:uncharacterized protein (DUF302 family)|nr:DUF302 domain-containing protein [Candidatus Thermoplasmatota archaeon]